MEFSVRGNAIQYGPAEAPLAEITFFESEPGVWCIDHTFVSPSLAGQGIGSQLAARAVDEIRRRGGRATAACSFARAWLDKHPEAQNP